jgi:uncharacterized repeat protein (TIGR01451 family)
LEGFLLFDGSLGKNQDWTISNLKIQDFDVSLFFSYGAAGSVTAFNDTTINNNYIRIANDLNSVVAPADTNQNIGIHYSFGTNQTISNNVIEILGDGLSDPSADINGDRSKFSTVVGMQSNTSGGAGYNNLVIDGNQITVLHAAVAGQEQRIIGIWDNGHAHKSNITISNNSFTNEDPNNDPLTNRQQAFWVTSHSNSPADTAVTYSNNTVEGASIAFKYLGAPEYSGQNYSAAGNAPVVFIGNTVTDTKTGLLIQGAGQASLFNNSFSNSEIVGETGIQIVGNSKVSAIDNTISGFATGADVNGSTALFQGNNLSNNTSRGLLIQNGSTVDAGQTGTGTNYTGLGISTGDNDFTSYTGTGAWAIRNLNARPAVGSEGPPYDAMAQNNVFKNADPTFIASIIEDDTDNSTLGFVNVESAAHGSFDLEVTSSAPCYSDHEVSYYVTVTNTGNSDASVVVLTDTLPAGATILRVESDDLSPTYANNIITANIGTLGAGESITFKVVIVPTANGTLTHEAEVTSTDSQYETDENNNIVTGSIVATTGGSGVVTISKILGKLVIKGDSNNNLVQIVPGANANSYTIIGLAGTQIKFKGVVSSSVTIENVKNGITANLGTGNDLVVLDSSLQQINLLGGLTINGNDGDDAVYILGGTTQGVNFNGNDGNDRFYVKDATINKNLLARGLTGNDEFRIESSEVKGTTSLFLGQGDDSLSLIDSTFRKSLLNKDDFGGNATVCITGIEVFGSTSILLGNGNDDLTLTDSSFQGAFTWDGGSEDDTFSACNVSFAKKVSLNGSLGNDEISIAHSSFLGLVSIEGSRGNDSIDTSVDNDFDFLPTIKNVEDVVS